MRDNINLIYEYAESKSGPVSEYLREVERQTYLKTMAPQMLSGHLQGRLLSMLSSLLRPRRILEIGTFTGYSALCLAEGLAEDGELHTIEGNPENAWLARENFAKSPLGKKVFLHQGQALDLLPGLSDKWDIIFLDGDKKGYPEYFRLLASKLEYGGLLIADNVLWDGKISDKCPDTDVIALRKYNDLVQNSSDFQVVLLPLRDGISIARKSALPLQTTDP